jgi:two-component system, OmpR family, copper resistance phosphate regulon response regulator CusR
MNILIIEDEVQVASFIKQGLEELNNSVDVAYDGVIGERLALSREYDAIILDIIIPGINGFELCRAIKKLRSQTPVLMLTTLATTTDKVTGLNLGADDYMTKPFEFEELIARLKALVRRQTSGLSTTGQVLIFEDLKLDLEKKVALRSNKLIRLSAKEFALLEYFMRNPGRAISRSELAEKVWGIKFETGTNVVEVYINMVRNKIDRDFQPKLLQTRIGLGYVLEKEQ